MEQRLSVSNVLNLTIIRNKFDFDVGYLVKSPCRGCPIRPSFPKCIDTCDMLDKIQTLAARGISCTRSGADVEPLTVSSKDFDK